MSKSFTFTGRIRSIKYAIIGILTMLKSQHNAWVHAVATVVVCGLGLSFGFTAPEWCWIILAIMAVWTAEALKHAILPAFTLGVAGAAWYARMLRSSMLDILGADYMRTAYAKGLPERLVLLRHAIPNAIQPVIAMVGMDLGYYLGGVVVIESVFSWPGMGKEIWQAIQNLDIRVITGSVTLAALAVVLMNLVVDVVNAAIDPRVRLGERPAD